MWTTLILAGSIWLNGNDAPKPDDGRHGLTAPGPTRTVYPWWIEQMGYPYRIGKKRVSPITFGDIK